MIVKLTPFPVRALPDHTTRAIWGAIVTSGRFADTFGRWQLGAATKNQDTGGVRLRVPSVLLFNNKDSRFAKVATNSESLQKMLPK